MSIPEKLYIPTVTLNFNNIMSSESVSPVSFYEKRGFGYKRFKIEPNSLKNRIVLYDKYPIFDIHDQDLENYPLAIEIDTKSLDEDVVQEQNGSFFADKTIYLNPFTTKIYFRNEQEKTSTLSKAEPSIETKMVALYKNCFELKPKNIDCFELNIVAIEDSKIDNSKFISKDRKINKLKGLLYAYLLATNKSISDDIVALKKLSRNLQNTLSAIITSHDGRANYQQDKQLKSLYQTINSKFENIFLTSVLKEKADLEKRDFVLLKKEKVFEYWLQIHNYSIYQIQEFNVPKEDKDKAFKKYIQMIDNQIENLEQKQRRSKIEISKLPILQNYKVSQISEQKEFITKLFNEYLEEAYNSEEFIQSRYEFARSGGKVFKEEIQNEWNGSQSQQYINALLKNLNAYEAFDIKNTNNLTLESFAAFCQKGESDIDKLEDYLIYNEIGDFRIAFSLWGIIFGFASMPKTLTNDLFLSGDSGYISEVYKYIYKQIHGVELEGKLIVKKHEEDIIISSENIPTNKNILKDSSDGSDIILRLSNCKLKDEQLKSIQEIYKQNKFIINDKFFKIIMESKIGIGKIKIKEIKKALGYTVQENKETSPRLEFHTEKPILGTEFYKDENAWYYIEAIIPEDKKKKVKKEINWIQKLYKDGGYEKQGKWISVSDNSNQAVIRHFKNNSNKNNSIEPNLLNTIVSKLESLYLQNK